MDTEYVIDSAVELGDLTPLEWVCLSRLPAAYGAVRRLVDTNQSVPEHFLQNTARAEFGRAEPALQNYLALQCLPALRNGMLDRIKERAAFLVQKRVQTSLGISETPRLAWGIDPQPTFPRSVAPYLVSGADVTETNVLIILEHELGELRNRLLGDMDRITQAVAWYREDGGKRYRFVQQRLDARQHRGQVHCVVDQDPGDGESPSGLPDSTTLAASLVDVARLARRKTERPAPLRKKARAAIKKATKLFMSLGQEENLRMLVSGHEVALYNEDSPLKFVLKPLGKAGWLEDRTLAVQHHTPYDLHLLTKDDVHVARLCVYMDQTPVLDQLLALTLFIRSGEELEILQKANWFGFGDAAGKKAVLKRYPQLKSKFPSARKKSQARSQIRLPEAFLREQEHWDPYRGRVRAWVDGWMQLAALPAIEIS